MPKDHSYTKAQREKIKKTLKSLDRFEDKVWYYLHLTSRNYIVKTDLFSVDERDSIESSGKKGEQEATALREALGLPGKIGISESDEAFTDEIKEIIKDEIYQNGDPKLKKEVYKKLAVIETKICLDLAKEVEDLKKKFPEDDPYREWKALYITNRALTQTGMIDQGLNELYSNLVMEDLSSDRPQVITEDEIKDFTELGKGANDKLSPEEKALVELGKRARTDIKIPYVKVPGKEDPERDPEIMKWLEESGNKMIEDYNKERLIDGYKRFSNDVLNYKPSLFSDTKQLDSFYEKELDSTNLMLIRAAKNQLIDTYDKKSGKNAPLFEKIVKDLKTLDNLISGGEYTKAHLLKETIGKECLKYMDGKEKVRRNDYGRDRIDAILAVMSEVLPDSQFQKEIEKINTIRGAKPGTENYINLEDYKHPTANTPEGDFTQGDIYRSWVQKGIEKETERLDKAENDRTIIPDIYKGNLATIEGLYGRNFDKSNKTLMAAFDGIGGNSKLKTFKPITDEFVAVGKYGASGRKLSEKDFVAIAYAGALTPEAAAKDPRFADAKPENKALYTGTKYTSRIGGDSLDADTKQYSDVIQFGRTSAADAMKEYENGNKQPLAHILASGIKTICDKTKNADKLYHMTIGDAEMLGRMTDMMYRDTDLFILANKEGVGNEYLRYGKSVKTASHIVATGMKSLNKLQEAEKNKTKLPKNEKIKAVTDIVVKRILDESYNMTNRRLLQNPEYKKELKAIEDKYNREIAPINAELNKNMVGKEFIERRAQLFDQKKKLDEYLEYNKGSLREKYLPENKFMNSISTPESYKKLRQDVYKAVEKSGVYKKSGKDIFKKIEDKKFAANMQSIIESHSANHAPATKENTVKKQEPQKAQQTPGLG